MPTKSEEKTTECAWHCLAHDMDGPLLFTPISEQLLPDMGSFGGMDV